MFKISEIFRGLIDTFRIPNNPPPPPNQIEKLSLNSFYRSEVTSTESFVHPSASA